jgi:pyridoxal phosphate enzyme (YggS family)
MSNPSSVAEHLAAVRQAMARAAVAAGRDEGDVALIAVSKAQPASAIRAAYAAGQRDFGENYVQELTRKAEELRDLGELRWHMIGHLQRNKARQVLREVSMIHSVDSIELARELGKRAVALRLPPARRLDPAEDRVKVLVEVAIAREAQKSGVDPTELGRVLEAIETEPELKLAGLMCVPPFSDDPRAARPFFDELARLREVHGGRARLPELSMGMSLDFDHAVAAGATLVRVGSAIFGPRPAPAAQ